jgi:hypothetical protein
MSTISFICQDGVAGVVVLSLATGRMLMYVVDEHPGDLNGFKRMI